MYAEEIVEHVSPLPNLFKFIDVQGGGSSFQRIIYNGHKRMNFLIYHTINTPDGLIFTLMVRSPDFVMISHCTKIQDRINFWNKLYLSMASSNIFLVKMRILFAMAIEQISDG